MWATILKGKNPRKPWTVRYDVDAKQREKSFATKAAAEDFRAEKAYEGRVGSFIDPKKGAITFAEYARTVVDSMAVSSGSMKLYNGLLTAWIDPWAGTRTLQQVAKDREGATTLVNKTMTGPDGVLLSYVRRGACRSILLAVLDEAVRAERLSGHLLGGINLVRSDVVTERKDFIFPSHKEISLLAEECGIVIWLMRGCGLRVREALAVAREDFRDGGTTLRVSGQASTDGMRKVPLKHRKAEEFRDVPVPDYLWAMVEHLPDGPVCQGTKPGAMYATYTGTYKAFTKAARRIGIAAGFTLHSLRHAFASALLANLVPITDVAEWLGHREISVTYRIYSHLIPSAAGKAKNVLDREYALWAGDEK